MEEVKPDSPRIQKLKESARKISIREGALATVQGGFGDSYITPFALALNSTNAQIALLSSFPGLLGPISQWFGSKLIETKSRKKVVLFAILFQSLMWIPIILLSFLYWKGVFAGTLPILLIVFFSAYVIFGNLATPAWFSWMGEIVKDKERGRYFSKRNRIAAIVAVVCSILAAFFLDFFRKNKMILLGFSIFFFLAMIFRLLSRELFKKQYEPKLKLQKGYYFSFHDFIKKAPKNNFGKFTIYRSLINFATFIAGPFFAVYMLKNLGFSYVTFMIVNLSSTIFSILALPAIGKFSDTYGNYETMKISSILIAVFPVLWLFSSSPIYLFFGPMMITGLAWTAFNLAAGNFVYDSVTPQKRAIAVTYHNILIGVGVFLGACLGGLLLTYIDIRFMEPLLFVFIISAVARGIISMVMLPMIKEIKEVQKFNTEKTLRNMVLNTINIPQQWHHSSFGLFFKKKTKESK